jgi:formate dehydrogenase subunit gamma
MVETTPRPPEPEPGPEPERDRDLPRFAPVERALHWVNAGLFAVVMATAAILYVGPLSVAVGRRPLVRSLHVYTGLLLPVPWLAAFLGRWRGPLLDDARRLNRWSRDDRRWFLTRGRDRRARLGKFNPGQKLNAAFTVGAIVVMVATGSIMHWFSPFPVDWRTGATFVHDWTAIFLFVAITGHVALAAADRDALGAMLRGSVPAEWARRHRPRWHDELVGADLPQDPGRG